MTNCTRGTNLQMPQAPFVIDHWPWVIWENTQPDGATMKKPALIMFLAAAMFPAEGGGYHVIGKIQIGGEGGWDYLTLDGAARKLYVSHGTHVVVVDVEAGKVV